MGATWGVLAAGDSSHCAWHPPEDSGLDLGAGVMLPSRPERQSHTPCRLGALLTHEDLVSAAALAGTGPPPSDCQRDMATLAFAREAGAAGSPGGWGVRGHLGQTDQLQGQLDASPLSQPHPGPSALLARPRLPS